MEFESTVFTTLPSCPILHKSINAIVNNFIVTFSYLFNSIDFDSSGVLVKNKHISQLHSISLLQFFLNVC